VLEALQDGFDSFRLVDTELLFGLRLKLLRAVPLKGVPVQSALEYIRTIFFKACFFVKTKNSFLVHFLYISIDFGVVKKWKFTQKRGRGGASLFL
jgi:hypothetical protein